MVDKPLLSIVFVVQNQREAVEPTLTSFYELSEIPFELFIINDGSSDGSGEVIQSLVDHYQHERTFYFEHPKSGGRGHALNEALLQANGQLFWAPESVAKIDEELLGHHLNQLSSSTNVVLLQNRETPESFYEWLEMLEQDNWMPDANFIWHLPQLASSNRFFNPYMNHFQGMELALRMGDFSYRLSEMPWQSLVSPVKLAEHDFLLRQEMLLSLIRQTDPDESIRLSALEKLDELEAEHAPSTENIDNSRLEKAFQLKQDGKVNKALKLVEKVLENYPEHEDARNLKIEILEKKRRFVEASELKHEAASRHHPKEPELEASSEQGEIVTSVIIPTTAYGKPALENCLLSISEYCDLSQLELIIIDNASLDDTHDYLSELQEKDFMRCKVITNRQNKGFAASINQGLEKAGGRFACLMHNDVECSDDVVARLQELLETHPGYGIIGPVTDKTLNPAQDRQNADEEGPMRPTEYLDSFCMMMRTELNVRMDEAYKLAFFEDIDLCFQIQDAGYNVGIANDVELSHYFGKTTQPLVLDTESEQYWKNVAYFNDKWEVGVFSEKKLQELSTFDQLLVLDEMANPVYPEKAIIKKFDQLFTDELRTEISNTNYEPETLCQLLHLFMVMNKRDILRRFEDRAEDIELPPTLIYQLVRFYYQRNIYSRCTYYLNQLKPEHETLRADLYRLAILVGNKDFDQAIPSLSDLMERAPSNPTLYKLASEIHNFNGNDEEAESFLQLARQVNPFAFSEEHKDAFGFER